MKKNNYKIREKVVTDIIIERGRQDLKWGEQNHDPMTWVPILAEEVGEAAQEALRIRFNKNAGQLGQEFWRSKYREEMIQCAAVAMAAVECLDRGVWMIKPPLVAKLDPNRKALQDIGNILGGPTMSYAPQVEYRELKKRIEAASKIIAIILGGKNGKTTK